MKMTFRWYGKESDPIPLPGMSGLYDRALGASYLNGIWETLCREHGNK